MQAEVRSDRALEVIDSGREPVFEWLADLAASELQAPVAMLSSVDEHRLSSRR